MQVDRYAITVQWPGRAASHAFQEYEGCKAAATEAAKRVLSELPVEDGFGNKPAVHIWYLIDTFRKE